MVVRTEADELKIRGMRNTELNAENVQLQYAIQMQEANIIEHEHN